MSSISASRSNVWRRSPGQASRVSHVFLLYLQLCNRCATATFSLRRLRDGFYMRMLLQELPQRLAQNSHTTAVNNSYPGQSRKKSAVHKFFNFARRIVHSVTDDIDLRRHVFGFALEH